MVLKLFPLTKIPAGLWINAKWSSSNNTSSGKINFFLKLTFSGIDNLIVSPPFIKVAEVAITSLTVIYCFFKAFFKADFVKATSKIPIPYSWSRMGAGSLGTICNSVGLMIFLYYCQRQCDQYNYNIFPHNSFLFYF